MNVFKTLYIARIIYFRARRKYENFPRKILRRGFFPKFPGRRELRLTKRVEQIIN